jgi:hypothetical protein
MYPVGEEDGAQLLGFYASIIDEEGFCLRVQGEKIIRKRRDIDKKHVRGKPVGRRPPVHDYVIAPTPHQKLVDGFRYRLAIEVDHYVHASLLSNLSVQAKVVPEDRLRESSKTQRRRRHPLLKGITKMSNAESIDRQNCRLPTTCLTW